MMVEYLKNYKKLLEQRKNNQKEINDNELLYDDNYQKWSYEKEKAENLDSDIKELNKKYNELYEEKEKRIVDVVGLVSLIVSIVTIIILAASNPILVVCGPFMALMTSAIIYMITYLIIKTTPVLQKYILKNKQIIDILGQKIKKEKELSETKRLLNEYSTEIIKYRSISKQLNEKKNYIDESLNELLRNYAQPIFEEQLKNSQNDIKDNQQDKETKEEQSKTKTRKQ